jgi:hypothetical protein
LKNRFPGISMQKEEIQPCELGQHVSELEATIDAVCKSPPFLTSPKSCQFLRHIVHCTLNGKVDELKERLIGIDLMGRDASYDTGSDAGVRVRANDVRKRLAAYYATGISELEFTVDIPAGSYVPRFYLPRSLQSTESASELSVAAESANASPALLHMPELSLQQLALPTFIALFLCIICMRWQLAQQHPFVTFWNTVFQDHHALLYVPLSPSGEQRALAPVDRLEDTAPLFNLAGRFHAGVTLTRTLPPPSDTNDILILIGAIPASSDGSSPDSPALNRNNPAEDSRLVIDATPSGRRIVDRSAGNASIHTYGRAGLLTIANGVQRSIHIDGTDSEAIDLLIKTLCEPNAFPDGLIDSFQEGTVTQVVFPIAPQAQAVVFHESFPVTHTAMNGPQ